ncbi:hypothetical protein TNCV_3343901 [Trichonephila clavipes]|nr:hypothetical protein TNCV_3343901 [Trichonephila clavipes]
MISFDLTKFANGIIRPVDTGPSVNDVLGPVYRRDVIYTVTNLRCSRQNHRKALGCKTSSIAAPITCAAYDTHPPTPPFRVVSRRKEWNKVVFTDETRFNLSSDDNRVHMWGPRGEHLNPIFAL